MYLNYLIYKTQDKIIIIIIIVNKKNVRDKTSVECM